VHVGAVVALVGADPVEAVQVLFDGLHEVVTGDDCVDGGLADSLARVSVDVDVGLLLVGDGQIV
jgi:hypothetical protein